MENLKFFFPTRNFIFRLIFDVIKHPWDIQIIPRKCRGHLTETLGVLESGQRQPSRYSTFIGICIILRQISREGD